MSQQLPPSASQPIIVTLDPPDSRMIPGGEPVVLTAAVHNAGADMDQFDMDIEGIDRSWYTVQVESLALMGGDTASIPIKLHPPKTTETRAGRYVFQVRAISKNNPSLMGSTRGTLEIGSESVTITLTPIDIEWTPTAPPVQVTAQVQNTGVTVDKYDVEIDGIEASWYTVTMQGTALFPGDTATIPIKIHPPLGADTPAGHYVFEVRARSQANTNLVASTMGVVYIIPKADFDMTMVEPRRVTGKSGQYTLNLSNGGNVGIRIDLTASDMDDALLFRFQMPEPKVVVQQHSTSKVQVVVKPKKPKLVGPDQVYQFDLKATVLGADKDEDPTNDAKTASGTLIFTPYLKNWRLPGFVGLFSMIALLWMLPIGGQAFSACKPVVGSVLCQPTATPVILPTETPTSVPTAVPTLAPSATDTPAPPTATPPNTMTPTPVTLIVIEDKQFQGGVTFGGGAYRDGTSAHWIYGRGTSNNKMSVAFHLDSVPNITTTLTLVGVDSEDQARTPLHIRLNTTDLFLGMDPLPDDMPVSKSNTDTVPWGRFPILLPPGRLAADNQLTIENLDPGDKTDYYPIFMVLDKVEITLSSP